MSCPGRASLCSDSHLQSRRQQLITKNLSRYRSSNNVNMSSIWICMNMGNIDATVLWSLTHADRRMGVSSGNGNLQSDELQPL